MNKVNFDGFKNINAPEAWIENALAVPENNRKKPIPFIAKYKRILTVAACVLMVSVMSIPLYLFGKTEVSIPYLSVTKSKHNLNTEDLTSQLVTEDTTDSQVQSPYFTEKFTSDTTIDYENIFPTDNTSISPNVTQPLPTVVATQASTEGTSPAVKPTVTPTNPTTPTTPKPTNPIPTTPPPTKPVPTNTTKPIPTQPNTGAYISMVPSCMGVLSPNYMFPDSGYLYCCLYDSFGNLVGDTDLYSFEHIAKETPTPKGEIILSYDPTEKGLKLREGTYSYCFYLKGGVVVFEGNITVF